MQNSFAMLEVKKRGNQTNYLIARNAVNHNTTIPVPYISALNRPRTDRTYPLSRFRLSKTITTIITLRRFSHNSLPLIQHIHNRPRIPHHLLRMRHQQKFFRIRRQTKISRRFSFGQVIDPAQKVRFARTTGEKQIRSSVDDDKVLVEGGRGQDTVDDGAELGKVGFVVDFATVGFGDQDAEYVPGYALWSDV